jgi:hypothetical protein
LLRRLRGIAATAVVWGLLWLPFGLALALASGPPSECLYCPPHWLLRFVAAWSAWGAFSGALFAVILIVMERSRTLFELKASRTAVWGALAALVLPLALTILDLVSFSSVEGSTAVAFAVALALGAPCAVLTLKLARRGVDHDLRAAA